MKTFKESPREIPVVGEYDVIVVGGGTAGVGAAVAAGREGAKTLVVEQAGWLIGYMDTLWGQGLTHAITFQDKNDRIIMKGIPYEIVDRLYRQNAAIMPIRRNVIKNTWDKELDNNYNRWQASIDSEVAKDLAFQMCEEAGVDMLLHTWFADVIMEGNRVKGIIVENKAGRQAIMAQCVVDCTGDADVAARAGAPYRVPPKEELYEVTRGLALGNVDTARVRQYVMTHLDRFGFVCEPLEVPEGLEKPLFAFEVKGSELEISRNGLSLKGGPGSHSHAMGIGIKKNTAGVHASVDNVDGTNPWEISKAEVNIRHKITAQWRRMKKEVVGYEECVLLAGSYDLGVLETRLIEGEYTITLEEMLKGTRHADAVFQTAMPTDAHLPKEYWSEDMCEDTYDLPFRTLLPKKVDGLLVAGRCISMDHPSVAALRKIPLCIAMGEAAGTAAALCARLGVTTHQLDIPTLQRQLLKNGVLLSDELTAKLAN